MSTTAEAIPFIKIEGAGNTCVVVEDNSLPKNEAERKAAVIAICGREHGIGVDQLLVVEQKNPLRFRIWNCDGTTAGMCGNGARAILRLAEIEGWIGPQSPGTKMQFAVGDRRCEAERLEEIGAFRVNLGMVKTQPRADIFLEGQRIPYWPADVGNRHAVIFCGRGGDWTLPSDFSLAKWGKTLCDELQSNIEFVQEPRARDQRPPHPLLKALVWEIGAGATLACGSGALAIAAAWQRRNQSLQEFFTVSMPGGELEVRLTPRGAELAGPSAILDRGVFSWTRTV